MQAYTAKIREAAKRLFAENRVDAVIGFRKGTVPFMSEPYLAKNADQVDQLTWDSNCGINLANYLPKRTERLGIVAKGCDSRNIAIQIQENQIKREQLVILGVPCKGMIDRRRIDAEIKGKDILTADEADGKVIVKGKGFEQTFDRAAVLQDNCAICIHRNPVLFDEMIAEPVPEQEVDRYADIKAIDAMSTEERWKHFEELLSGCIRCYACRNACPSCYCPTCFVDESRPQWVGKTTDPTDTRTFHFLRAYHVAGRCTDCGSCERACPVGIKVRQLTKKLEMDIKALYGYEAGVNPEERPPLDVHRPDDPEPFIK